MKKMNLFIKLVLISFPVLLSAQKKTDAYEVKYHQYENDKKMQGEQSLIYQNGIVYLSKPESQIQQYTDFINKVNISTVKYEEKVYKKVTKFNQLPEAVFNANTKIIMGYTCYYASFTYFSNKIEVWYSQEPMAKGSPYSNYLPYEDALVMEISVNGSKRLSAYSIEKIKKFVPINGLANSEILVSDAEFEEIRIKSRFTKLDIFKEEKINFDPTIRVNQDSALSSNQVYTFSKGTVVMKKIKLPIGMKNSDYIFAKLTCKSNGDAYDRTGSVFIVPDYKDAKISVLSAYQNGLEKLPVYIDNDSNSYQGIVQSENYSPPIELMRFYTSFGADHFNEKRQISNYDWSENVSFKQEVTKLIPSDSDEIWVGVFIGNYDKGGHIVSLEFDFHPSFEATDSTKSEKYISPLFSTVNTLEMSGQNYGSLFQNDTLKMTFTLPENVVDLNLLFTTTGHGGWGGGDEFNPKLNQIFIDGKEMFKIVPWRTDCATYRLSNPASGNFENGLSSSDLSRSNWCPATLTPPFIIPLPELKPGEHTLEVVIDQGKNEGTNSNHWNVTGILTGTVEPQVGQ